MSGRLVARASPLGLAPDDLLGLAERVNAKRRFLFVSRVLGKHVPVPPAVPLLAGGLLALRWAGDDARARALVPALLGGGEDAVDAVRALRAIPAARPGGPAAVPVVVGFAETATALGHAVADALGAPCWSTTRRRAADAPPPLEFREAHSHAPEQLLHAPLAGHAPLLLVDDELTTGRTALAAIRALHAVAPRPRYGVLCLVDHLRDEDRERWRATEEELGVPVELVSLLSCALEAEPDAAGGALPVPAAAASAAPPPAPDVHELRLAGPAGGRTGLAPAEAAALGAVVEDLAGTLRGRLGGPRVLVLGTGEFMYLPMRLAAALGPGARTGATTRSPIRVLDRPGYPVRTGLAFPAPEDPALPNFVYGIEAAAYDDVVVVVEDPPGAGDPAPLLAALAGCGLARPALVHVLAGRGAPVPAPAATEVLA